ncbi:MAG: YdiU family protein [Actinomycetota bacterium]
MTTTDAAPTVGLDQLFVPDPFVVDLPADPDDTPGSRQVPNALYSRVTPVAAPAPTIIGWSAEVAADLGLAPGIESDPQTARVFTGTEVAPGSDPYAMNYGGHQFGNWAGQLGDGRAIALGAANSRSGGLLTLQLKGAGPTPYSRRADGFAVLRSSIREFLCSEAMHHLGVPTTRALSLATTGSDVVRDMLYDGNPRPEPGAVVCRVAPSFLRFGSYQLWAARQALDMLRLVADHTIRAHFGHLIEPSDSTSAGLGPEVYSRWFAEVCDTSCAMVVEWMRVGFVHGVMNTDNMSIHGVTIDYGPYGWLDDFDPDWTPNTTDAAGRRYRYGYQPQITQWNLLQLANALVPLVGEPAPLEEALNGFVSSYHERFRSMMLAKLGLTASTASADDALIADLVGVMPRSEVDMTIFFRRLADLDANAAIGALDPAGPLRDAWYTPEAVPVEVESDLDGWLSSYRARVVAEHRDTSERRTAMNRTNPLFVLRNYLAQQAIDAAEGGDASEVTTLLDLLRRPYDEQPGREQYGAKRPDWARNRPGCSVLSCSS